MYAIKGNNRPDLKCKSGCDYYGNVQWDGYCSKCHREQIQQKKLKSYGHQTDRDAGDKSQKSQITGFSKFEEKKRQQTDKKKTLLKLNVFRKSTASKEGSAAEVGHALYGPATVDVEKLRQEHSELLTLVGKAVETDVHKCIHSLYTRLSNEAEDMSVPVDDLSERTQNFYQVFTKRMDASTVYQNVNQETKEQLLDYLEKYAMTCLYRVLFCQARLNRQRNLINRQQVQIAENEYSQELDFPNNLYETFSKNCRTKQQPTWIQNKYLRSFLSSNHLRGNRSLAHSQKDVSNNVYLKSQQNNQIEGKLNMSFQTKASANRQDEFSHAAFQTTTRKFSQNSLIKNNEKTAAATPISVNNTSLLKYLLAPGLSDELHVRVKSLNSNMISLNAQKSKDPSKKSTRIGYEVTKQNKTYQDTTPNTASINSLQITSRSPRQGKVTRSSVSRNNSLSSPEVIETNKNINEDEIINNIGMLKSRYNTNNSQVLRVHVSQNSLCKKFLCEHCGRAFERIRDLTRHLDIHSDIKSFVCSHCCKGFSSRWGLVSHEMTVHANENVRCGVCNKVYKNGPTLRSHMNKVHKRVISEKSIKPTLCGECSKVFKNEVRMKDHFRKMHGEGFEFICNDCSAIFRTKEKLRVHIKVNHMPPTVACYKCSKIFVTNIQLVAHLQRDHLIDSRRSYICEVCGKLSKMKLAHDNHLLTHTDKMPFTCQECGKCFRTVSNLQQHSRIHSDIRAYTCNLCEKSFKIRHHLQQHMAVHGMVSTPYYGKRGKQKRRRISSSSESDS